MLDRTGNITLIAALGNPGPEYAGTRHNAGFMVANELAKRWNIAFDKKKFQSRFAETVLGNRKVVILKPSTFMNNSGQAVIDAVNFYHLAPADLLVVLDDMALPVGRIRLRAKGSAGGQKGLADIINRVGDDAVPRLRVGIGSPPPGSDAVRYVLGRFDDSDQPVFEQAVQRAAQAAETVLTDGLTAAMDIYNRPEPTPDDAEPDERDEP